MIEHSKQALSCFVRALAGILDAGVAAIEVGSEVQVVCAYIRGVSCSQGDRLFRS